MSTEVMNNVDVLYKPGKLPKDTSLPTGNLPPKSDELYNRQQRNDTVDSVSESIEPVDPKVAATSRAITPSRSLDEIPDVKQSEKKLTKISHGRSRSSLSDIDCTFVNRPTSVSLNVDSLSDEQLKDTVLQLEHEWVFWYDDRKGLQKGMTTADYENSIRNLGKFGTIQNFWRYYNNLQDVSKLPDGTNIRIFKAGIKPTWEDPMNSKGGKWVISTNKDSTHFIWSKVLLAIIGEQFEHSDALCGVVVSIRNKGDTINVWNKSGDNPVEIETTINELKKVTGLSVKYRLHADTSTFTSPERTGNQITRSYSNPVIKDASVDLLDEEKKRRRLRKHKKSSSVSEDSEVTPAIGHSKSSSMDMGRKFDVVTSPRDFRRSFDLPKKKLDIGQIKTHSRSPSNSEDEVRHRRTPSQDLKSTTPGRKNGLPPPYPTKKAGKKPEEVTSQVKKAEEEEVVVKASSIASEYIYIILAFSAILTLMYLYHRVLRW